MDDNQPNNIALDSFVSQLQSDGVTAQDIMSLVEQISNIASTKFYAELISVFTEEDIRNINDQAQNQDEANILIKQKFNEKTQQDAEEIKEQIITDLAKAYLEDYLAKKNIDFSEPPQFQG